MTPDNYILKKALISVSDKTGLIEFCKELVDLGIEIYSTGGTYSALSKSNIPVKSVSDLTNFPEILEGRVKTLHPGIHAGLLADLGKPDHIAQMKEHNLDSIDLLVVNLYPFEQTLDKENATHEELIENIDIGGPGMLRAAAKNYKWTAIVINPNSYNDIIETLKANKCTIPEKTRAKLAGDVFTHTAYYDSLIAEYFNKYNQIDIPEKLTIPMKKAMSLRYGENPHQSAALLGSFNKIFKQLHGKELSYNNLIDMNAAAQIILEFDEPALAIIKHTNPCGVGLGENLVDAWHKAFATDNVSPFGGIISVNRKIDFETAKTIHDIFTEVIIAPGFSPEAIELLTKKRDRRLIQADLENIRENLVFDIRSIVGGLLMQTADTQLIDDEKMRVVTKRNPTPLELRSLMFGWKICKHVKSNAIVYTSEDRTLAIGAGQMSRVDSSRIAVEKAKLMGLSLDGSTVASDAFFPFADGLMQAVESGATAVIQPGGSVRDEEVIAAADENNIAMIFTGMRHFRH